jgi:hypothetical protein
MRHITVLKVALSVILGSGLCFQQAPPRGSLMELHTTDANGRPIVKMVRIPPPVRVAKNGLSHLQEYAKRLVASKSPDASLIITCLDQKRSCLIMRLGGVLTIMESIELAPPIDANPEHEKAVRKLFKKLGISCTHDVIHDYNGVRNAMRDLEYPVKNNAKEVTRVLNLLLRDVYHVKKEEGLDFLFETKAVN